MSSLEEFESLIIELEDDLYEAQGRISKAILEIRTLYKLMYKTLEKPSLTEKETK